MGSSPEPDRSSLLAAKLSALVGSTFGPSSSRTRVDFPAGAGLVEGDTAWLLVDGPALRAFGPAMVWASRRRVEDLHLLVDYDAAVLARRAACFASPPVLWSIEGTTLERAEPAPAPEPTNAPSAPELAGLLVDADLEVVIEDGIVRGEVNGLEVARIVHGVSSTGVPLDAPLLEVGVGLADRELTAMLHGDLPPVDQLARVVEIVRAHRRPGAERHPLNLLAPERWLRARLVAHPERIGLRRLQPSEPAVPRPNLRDTAVAIATGETDAGEPVVVACSVGVDLDLVPAAADARAAFAPGARLLLAVPERDAHPVTVELASRLLDPAQVVALPGDWRE